MKRVQTLLAPSTLRPPRGLIAAFGVGLALAATPALAQDDDDGEVSTRPETVVPADGGFDAVRAIERDPRTGTPLIANKLFPMQFRGEVSAMFDYSLSDRYLQHYGGHLSLGFHIFDWLAIEGFAGGFYPQELQITQAVRIQGFNPAAGRPPALSGLWQTFAFGGINAQWAPIYGKLSMVSEFDLSFQFYFIGGIAIEGTAKPIPSGDLNEDFDFYTGLASGTQFDYAARVSAVTGAGIRLIPWEYVAFRVEVRNFTGVNPPVSEEYSAIDISNLPTLQLGVSFLFP
jgi:outer membrane beta-barrel protein